MREVAVCLLLACFSVSAQAQRNEIYNDRIASLQVMVGDDWLNPPISSGEPINISFDDLTHEYHRYTYSIEHYEADWTASKELFASDYVNGFAEGNTIDDYEESLNTNTLYTHYALRIPNERCKIKLSGNYRLTVFDDNDEKTPVLSVCFMIVDQQVGIAMNVTSNTDIDINNRHQQVEWELNYGNLKVTNPAQQIKTVVMQNYRWDNAVVNAKPQYTTTNGLRWHHCRDLIFAGGNEFRKFEMLDVNHTTMGLEAIHWDGIQYQAYPWTDEPRLSYIYDEDANGAFVIRNSDNVEINNTSDYLNTHFRLASPRLPHDIYISGWWTNNSFLPKYKMAWNEEKQLYECEIPLKQGYYSYQYLMQMSDGTTAFVPSEGCFYQTDNTYQILVYYRGLGDRTDKLIGFRQLTTSD